jgi:hypothetical protein
VNATIFGKYFMQQKTIFGQEKEFLSLYIPSIMFFYVAEKFTKTLQKYAKHAYIVLPPTHITYG